MRRVHVKELHTGVIVLDDVQARHVRDVLRFAVGDEVEVFDDSGRTADAAIARADPRGVDLAVGEIREPRQRSTTLSVAAAVPKHDRADWMVEKLSEIGVDWFIPLATERSVVLPEGKTKFQRWERIAVESAKQSRRDGVMRIAPLADVRALTLDTHERAIVLSTRSDAAPLLSLGPVSSDVTILVGPEGGWSDAELAHFTQRNLTHAKLTATILRVETAAVCAAAVVAMMRSVHS